MRAVTISRFGGPAVLTLDDQPVPRPGPGQVSIQVTHAAVGLADVLMRRGEFGGEPPIVPGLEAAGTIREMGPDVTGLRVGERVVTLSRPTAGGYAEVSLADAGVTVSLEDSPDLDPAVAVSALPNATTAILALDTVAHLRPGGRLLVLGGLGALGAMAGQLGRHLDAGQIVATVRRPEQLDTARGRGFDKVLLADELADRIDDGSLGRFDVVVDPVGGPARRAGLAALASLGRLVCVGNAAGAEDVTVGGNELWLSNAGVLGLNAGGLLAEHPELGHGAARRALALLAAGDLTVDYAVLPLEQAEQAHRRLEAGGTHQRLVLAV